jgi:hypothetical protein
MAGKALKPMDVQCHYCGKRDRGTQGALLESGWEWFTGYNPARTDVCAECYRKHTSAADDLRIAAYTPKPSAVYNPKPPEGSA